MSRSGSTRARRAPVALTPWGPDEWAVVVRPGSDSVHLYQAVADLPAGLEFVEAFGDVEITLIYRVRTLPPSIGEPGHAGGLRVDARR